MRTPIADPIIAEALARSRAAAELLELGAAELRAALAVVERHPDYGKTERARRRRPRAPSRETLTLAWWVHNGIHSALFDASPDEAAGWIGDDADLVASLRVFLEAEDRETAQRPRRPRKAASGSTVRSLTAA